MERAAIQHLLTTSEWLQAAEWNLDQEMYLGVNAIIRTHNHDYAVRLTYPSLFPNVPPIVTPSDPTVRWSSHQYNDGSLCLEWGPDTWHHSVTGAQVLESAFKLLSQENPLGGDGVSIPVPSRHALTAGQELRSHFFRFFLDPTLSEFVTHLQNGSLSVAKVKYRIQNRSTLVLLTEIRVPDAPPFENANIPKEMERAFSAQALLFKTDLSTGSATKIETRLDLEEALGTVGLLSRPLKEEFRAQSEGEDEEFVSVILVDQAAQFHLFVIPNWNETTIHRAEIFHSDRDASKKRTPANLESIQNKSVAIVGVGSVGGKVAVSLARMGVSKFLFIDEDIFKPENLGRNVLDWRNVGEHKVDAIKQLVEMINPLATVDVVRLNLVGQESTKALGAALSKLAHYDLVIDATANPRVFNLLAAASENYSKSIVWGEIFAGGIGGLIARSRRKYDPDPQTMRAAFFQFTSEHPYEDLPVVRDYTVLDEQGNVVSASDADVEVIAGNVTRLAIDTLCEPQFTEFPFSMYLVGLKRGWVFEAPFHTIPIATDQLLPSVDGTVLEDSAFVENKEFITCLLSQAKPMDHADSSS